MGNSLLTRGADPGVYGENGAMPTFAGLDFSLPPSADAGADDRSGADAVRAAARGHHVEYAEFAVENNVLQQKHQESLSFPLPPLVGALAEPLQLAGGQLPNVTFPGEEIRLVKPRAQAYADALDPFARQRAWERLDRLGVAFPYATPPPVRLVLPDSIPVRAAFNPRNVDRWTSLEAPLAGCVALVAARQVAPPRTLWLLNHAPRVGRSSCPGGPAAELTAVSVVAEGVKLKFRVLAWQELLYGTESPPIEDQLAAWPADVPGLRDPGTLLWCLHPGLKAFAQVIAQALALSPDSMHEADRETIAVGAARYAAFEKRKPLDGTVFRELAIERITARTLGVVGQNRAGDLFWRRVLEAGTKLDRPAKAQLQVQAAGIATSPIVMLAELTHPAAKPPAWLPQAQWSPYGLSLFATELIQMQGRPAGGTPYRLEIDFANPAGPFVWAQNSITVRLVTMPAAHRSTTV